MFAVSTTCNKYCFRWVGGFGFQDVGLISDVLAEKQFIDIEPHTFSPEQFTDWNPFVQEIKRTGIVIGEWEPTAIENRVIHS